MTGIGAAVFNETTPYGMVLVDVGSMREGPNERDSVWGTDSTAHGVSVDAFWMDETEISNSKYKQFVENCFTLLPRQALHALILGFDHPTTGRHLHFEAPIPADMASVLDKWRNYSHSALSE